MAGKVWLVGAGPSDAGLLTVKGQQVLEQAEVGREALREMIGDLYRRLVKAGVSSLTGKIDIAGIIEDKINGMAVEDLEVMVLQVMKKELDTIVNLGALIGLILGLVNLLINYFL